MPWSFSSASMAMATMVMPILLTRYGALPVAAFGLMGGDIIRMWPKPCLRMWGMTAALHIQAARTLTPMTRSNFLTGQSATADQWMAPALLIR